MDNVSGTPTAIYCRMSKDRTGAGLGVARQEKECRELADRLGLSVVAVYSDNDLSASTGKPRPGYLRMMSDVAEGKVQAVVCWHPDRLTRRTSELESYITATRDVPTYTVTAGHFDLTTPAGRATAKTIGAWAQAEVEQKAERQKAKNRQLAAAGKRIGRGGPVPFGYADDRLSLHPQWGPLVQQAYADVLAGKGLSRVAMEWQEAGAPIPQGKRGIWDRASVKRVLSRESNAGLVVLQGKVLPGVQGEWEPLVSVSDFYAARAIITDPARRTTPGSKPRHLLSGIAVCDTCGAPLRRQRISSRQGSSEGQAYSCSNRKSAQGNCPAPVSVGVEKLEEWFVQKLLNERGGMPGLTVQTVDGEEAKAQGATLAELDERIRSIALQMAEPDADMASLTQALTEAKQERQDAESAPVVTRRESTLTVAQSWGPHLPEDVLLFNRRNLIKGQLREGGLRVQRVGRGKRLPLEERVSVAWID